MKIFKNLLIVNLILCIVFLNSCSKDDKKSFIKRDGNKLIVNGKVIKLQGICFGNKAYESKYDDFQEVPLYHHNEDDYRRIKDWGMNVVRFYMNYKTIENDDKPFTYKQTGWDWIDKNIEWAKKYGIYLIIDIHVSQGGYQVLAEGAGLWNDKKMQQRFTAMWKEIAKHYNNEPTIAGYDLLNEPIVTKSVNQWKDLAEKTINEIRKVDKNHLIVIEPILGIDKQWYTFHKKENLFLVNDKNVLYSFHFYHPHDFTHQYAIWTDFKNKDGGKYPDENKNISPWEKSDNFSKKVVRNKKYLEDMVKKYIDYGIKNNVPMFCGEFGADGYCFEKDKGGERWAGYMIDIFMQNNIHFTYHCYHESAFGVFTNDEGLPDENQARNELIEVFKNKLNGE